ASLILRRATVDVVGMLDPSYFVYTEEVDLCFRISKAGWGVYWVPTSEVLHWGGQSTQQASAEMFIQLYRSKIHFFKLHSGAAAAWAYKLILAAAAIPRILWAPLASLIARVKNDGEPRTYLNYVRLLISLPTL
ncbi:MAG: hypothetical protein WBR18_15850, partial [Anaerolineales bacterium]